jgi:predicted Ser/Thr protein kinase
VSLSCPACKSALAAEARFCASCGTPAPASNAAAPADPVREILKVALGRQYEIQRLLGRGGMGAVYLATEAALEREVAIKVLPPDRGSTKESRDRFRREARTAAKLSHPNIVPLHTFGDVDGTLYFVMGYVKGESLAARLKREGRLGVEDARRILIELCEALDYAHKLGIVHRDIKPDNVLIEEETGRAMLMDFGVAKALGAGQTVTEAGSVLGTPHYMSPEQAQGKADIDSRSDLYSLGVMGYAMLAGRLPFEGPTPGDVMVQHITKEAPSLRILAPETPTEVAGALMRCLEKDPARRWPEARSLRRAIDVVETQELPEDLAELRRDAHISVLGLYLSALAAFREFAQLTDPDATPAPWGILYGLTGLGVLATLYSTWLRRREGRSWGEIRDAVLLKPSYWLGWYPTRFRARGDVWKRLPVELRRCRNGLLTGALLWIALMPPQIIYMLGEDGYRRTGHRNPAQLVADHIPRTLAFAGVRTMAFSLLGLIVMTLLSAVRWARSPAVSGTNRHVTNAMFFKDTAARAFWTKPEVVSLLLPGGTASSRAVPSSPGELVSAITAAAEGLSGGARTAGGRARQAAQRIQTMLGQLDAEITSLSSGADPAEPERLAAKIASLGAAQAGEGEAKSQMRELLEKQLALLRGVESRLEGLKARRSRQLDLLRALWQQAQALASAGADPSRTSGATDRIDALCAEITDHADASSATRDLDPAMTESPTIERG